MDYTLNKEERHIYDKIEKTNYMLPVINGIKGIVKEHSDNKTA
ncbi:MAG: hypothetical protein QMD06_05085 [Candidatus Altarchaeum sp.]|nr:hypothetical protein [Candidatus Altarchaeum sp.]